MFDMATHNVILNSWGVPTKFKIIEAFMVDLVTCKTDEGPSKNERNRVLTTFLPLKAY